jgi:hypothetical protein
MERIVPDDESIRRVEEENPDASTTAKWRLSQAEATRKVTHTEATEPRAKAGWRWKRLVNQGGLNRSCVY